MDGGAGNRRPSPACAPVGNCRRSQRRVDDDDDGKAAAESSCTGESCRSCTAGAIADCVAVCCCPCAVVNFLALALVRLPWAVARRCLSGRRSRRRRSRGRLEGGVVAGNIPETAATSTEAAAVSGEANEHYSAEFRAGDVWLEMYEVGHLGFGRVSFTGIPYQDKPN